MAQNFDPNQAYPQSGGSPNPAGQNPVYGSNPADPYNNYQTNDFNSQYANYQPTPETPQPTQNDFNQFGQFNPAPVDNFNTGYANNNIPTDPYSTQSNQYLDPNANYTSGNVSQVPVYPQTISQTPEANYTTTPNQPIDQYSQQYPQPTISPEQNFYGTTQPVPDNNTYNTETNTFDSKKSGSKMVIILVGILIVALLLATVLLYILNQNRNNPTQDTTANVESSSSSIESSQNSSSSSSSSSSSNNSTESPAQLARIRNATNIPSTWLIQKFLNNGVNSTGECSNTNICSDSADADQDGLTNLEEYNYDTDPLNNDTSSSGISDGDKVNIYGLSPKIKDSNGDGVDDLQSLLSCKDPAFVTNGKMEQKRLDQISQAANLKFLHEPTIKNLRTAGATTTDLAKGYIEKSCTDQSSSLSSNTNSQANSQATSQNGPQVSL